MSLDSNIEGIMLVEGGRVRELCRRDVLSTYDDERMNFMGIRGALMLSIPETYEDLFGDTYYVTIKHDSLDVVLIPLARGSANLTRFLCMYVKRPYDIERIISEITKQEHVRVSKNSERTIEEP